MSFVLENVAQLEYQASLLSQGMAKHFSIDSNKKSKIYDLVCIQAGYPDGYQQFMGSQKDGADKSLALTKLFALKDTLHFTCDRDFESLAGSYELSRHDRYGIEMEQCFHIFFDDLGCWKTEHSNTDESITQSHHYAFIAKFFEVDHLTVASARMEKYGVPELCDMDKAVEFFSDAKLRTSEGFCVFPYDTRDEGSPELYLTFTMRVKSQHRLLLKNLGLIKVAIEQEEYGDVRSFLDDLDIDTSKMIKPLINDFLKTMNPGCEFIYSFVDKEGWSY